jgi:hypothetical protein
VTMISEQARVPGSTVRGHLSPKSALEILRICTARRAAARDHDEGTDECESEGQGVLHSLGNAST